MAVIGAGLSGLGMGASLRRAGIEDFVILERAADIGGTWRDNTYPGVAVDIPALAYQFTYAMKPDWSRVFAKGHEVKAYVDDFADRYGLRRFIRTGTEVLARTWDEDNRYWRLETPRGEITARFVISAIGPFVEPKDASIPGVETFRGKVLRSARWDHSYDVTGKRVAVVGTGASAVQIVPEIAGKVAQLDVYQRTAIWISPKFDPPIPKLLQRAFARIPLLERAAYAAMSAGVELLLVGMIVNYRRMRFFQRALERANRRFLERSVHDPDVRAKLTPDYGVGCKRPSVSNEYLATFNRDNVELVTEPIERVTATGIVAGGIEREIDAIVLATGFTLSSDPSNFRRTPVRGRAGFDLATSYEDERLRSYEGISLPGLPNHFMLFGPFGWTGGSWHVLVQTASRHIVRVLTEARRRGATVVEVTPEATDRFTTFARDRLAGSLWFGGSCVTANSYYFDHHGDTPFLRPTSARQARKRAETFPLADYEFAA